MDSKGIRKYGLIAILGLLVSFTVIEVAFSLINDSDTISNIIGSVIFMTWILMMVGYTFSLIKKLKK